MRYVLDSSAAIQWVLPEKDSAKAIRKPAHAGRCAESHTTFIRVAGLLQQLVRRGQLLLLEDHCTDNQHIHGYHVQQ